MSHNSNLNILRNGQVSYTTEDEFVGFESDYTRSVSYANFLNYDIAISDRSGVVNQISKHGSPGNRELAKKYSGKLLIIFEYEFTRFAAEQTLERNRMKNHPPNSLAGRFTIALDSVLRGNYFGTGRIKIRQMLTVSHGELMDNDFSVYVPEADCVVSVPAQVGYVEHPGASNKELINLQEGIVDIADKVRESAYVVHYVNHSKPNSKIFMTFGNEVLSFNAVSDSTLKDGIYFAQYEPKRAQAEKGMLFSIDPESYAKYGFFHTREEAITKGDNSKSIQQIENEERKHFITSKELDNKEKQLEQQAVKKEEDILEKFEKVIDKMTDQKKQNREHFLGVLKQTGEILKVAAPFITLVISLRAAFK